MALSEAFTRLTVVVSSGTITEADRERMIRPGQPRTVPIVEQCGVDLTLLGDLTMAMAAADVRRKLVDHFNSLPGDQYDAIRHRLADPFGHWQIVSSTAKHYPPSMKLSKTGLKDGDTVALVDSPQRENYKPLQDDTAEAIAEAQRHNFGSWTSTNSRTLASVVIPVASVVLALTALIGVVSGALPVIGQYVAGGVLAMAGVLALVTSINMYSAEPEIEEERILAGAITGGYALLGVAGLLLLPGGPGPWSMLLAGGLLAVSGWMVSRMIEFPIAINYAAQCVGVITFLVGAVALITKAGGMAISLGLGAMTMVFVTVLSARLALLGSGIPMPEVPAQGKTILRNEADLNKFDNATRNLVIGEIVNQEDRSIKARGILVGSAWGAVILLIISAALTGYLGMEGSATQSICVLVFWLAAIAALLFRGKASGDAAQQGSWLAGGFLIGAAFTLSAAVSGQRPVLIAIAALLLVTGALIGAWTAWKGKPIESPSVNSYLEKVEFLCFALVPIMWAVVIDLFGAVRGSL